MKKFISIFTCLLVIVMSATAYADTSNNYQTYVQMQENNEPIEEILKFYNEHKTEIDACVSDPEQLAKDAVATNVDPEIVIGEVPYEITRSGGGEDEETSMSTTQWEAIKGQATKGNILITKDDNTPLITHGHAAMVYVDCSKTIEILGYGYTPQEYNIDRWGDYRTAKLIYPSSVDFDTRKAAADTAKTTFVDGNWTYYLLPNVNNTSQINCATLVWRSYNAHGLTLGKSGASATPQSLLTGAGGIICKVSANWACDTTW